MQDRKRDENQVGRAEERLNSREDIERAEKTKSAEGCKMKEKMDKEKTERCLCCMCQHISNFICSPSHRTLFNAEGICE